MGENSTDKPKGNIYTTKESSEDVSHQIISSLFLGPQAENMDYFKKNVTAILDAQAASRKSYCPGDGDFISVAVKESPAFTENADRISAAVQKAAELLGKHSVPFWSPRYAAHMCMDMSMPSLLGYFMTMLYNPNNVSIEASPLTTVAEIRAGEQLCELFGFNIKRNDPKAIVAWGHITCGGTVANLESIWSARNLKFYPLSLRNATKDYAPLSFIAGTFAVETCIGEQKLFKNLSLWEILNLKVPTILEIPQRLYDEYGISSTFLQNVMEKYTIQSTGKGILEQQYGIENPIQLMVAGTRHYSWPKGGAITGIGSDNVIGVEVDDGARIDIKDLERRLDASLNEKRAVYAVVAIIGSTEEGAVDPLAKIVALRKKYQAKGLSFIIHADAAWGGYFASMLPRDFQPGVPFNAPPAQTGDGEGFVPDATLRAETQEDIFAIRFADSVTVDPHKAGYIPYPAGGLCYRDERQRYLVTWTSPYISRGDTTTSIGVFGVEGSKPGASAMSTWLSNVCIGMGPEGYGALLGEVSFTCSRLSAHWAAMSTKDTSFIVVPFNLLPSEKVKGSTPQKVEEERQKIRDHILDKSNKELVEADAQRPDNDKAMVLLRAIGSDLNINAFALNFRYSNGTMNRDVEEANYLNRRVVERLSVDSPHDDPTSMEFFLTSTEFTQSLYGKCADTFKRRLELEVDQTDLFVLRNVIMSPFPTEGNFIGKMVDVFRKVVEEEVEVCRKRNETRASHHSFVLQGTDQIYLVHRSMFHLASFRRQLIVSAKLDSEALKKYIEAQKANPTETFILTTQNKEDLNAIVTGHKDFEAVILTKAGKTIAQPATVSKVHRLKDRPLNSKYRDLTYPSGHMPFYLYGTPSQPHIDHLLTRAPNISLSASSITLNIKPPLPADLLSSGCLLVAEGVQEAALQPFLPTKFLLADKNFFFRPGARFTVTVYRDAKHSDAQGPGLAEVSYTDRFGAGEAVLGESVYVDSEMVNRDPYKRREVFKEWQEEFDLIGKELERK